VEPYPGGVLSVPRGVFELVSGFLKGVLAKMENFLFSRMSK